MMDVKMVVLDLDGTLLREDKTVSERSLEVLEECRERGILIAVATARSRVLGARYFTDFFMPDVLIHDGGARAVVGEEIIYNMDMDRELAMEIVRAFEGSNFAIRGDEAYFYSNEMSDYAKARAAAGFRVEKYCPDRGIDAPVYKLSVVIERDAAEGIVEKHPQLGYIGYSDAPVISFGLKDATKWGALAAVAVYLGIDIAHIAAIGDDWNDLEMIERCGIGVAMGNAIDEVKAVADYITVSNDEDGVAVWLEENVL